MGGWVQVYDIRGKKERTKFESAKRRGSRTKGVYKPVISIGRLLSIVSCLQKQLTGPAVFSRLVSGVPSTQRTALSPTFSTRGKILTSSQPPFNTYLGPAFRTCVLKQNAKHVPVPSGPWDYVGRAFRIMVCGEYQNSRYFNLMYIRNRFYI